jgi:hypothetical protein
MSISVNSTLDLTGTGAKITGLPAPTVASDAANKAYVDAVAPAIDSTSVIANGAVLERAALTGAITAPQNSNATQFAGVAANTSLLPTKPFLNFIPGTNTTVAGTSNATDILVSFNLAPVAAGRVYGNQVDAGGSSIVALTGAEVGELARWSAIEVQSKAAGTHTLTVNAITTWVYVNTTGNVIIDEIIHGSSNSGARIHIVKNNTDPGTITLRRNAAKGGNQIHTPNEQDLIIEGQWSVVTLTHNGFEWFTDERGISDDTFLANVSGALAPARGITFTSIGGDGIDYNATTHAFDVVVTDFAGTNLENDGANNLRIAATAAGAGLTGGGAAALAVGAGTAIAVNANDVAWTGIGVSENGGGGATNYLWQSFDFDDTATIAVTLTGSPPLLNIAYNLVSASVTETFLSASVAGGGITGGAGTALAVGAGDGITVNANDVAVNVTAIAGTNLENDGSNNLRIAATAAGAGLTGGGASVLAVGAGTGITVNANDIQISTIGADSFFLNGTAGVAVPTAIAGATVAGGGLTYTTGGILAVGAGTGVTVNANDVQLAAAAPGTVLGNPLTAVGSAAPTPLTGAQVGEIVVFDTNETINAGIGLVSNLVIGAATNTIRFSNGGNQAIVQSIVAPARPGGLYFATMSTGGGDEVVFLDEVTTETAANRIRTPGGVPYRLANGSHMMFAYLNIGTIDRWVILGPPSALYQRVDQSVSGSGPHDLTLNPGVNRVTFTGTNVVVNSVTGGTDTGRLIQVYFTGSGVHSVINQGLGVGNEANIFNPGEATAYYGPRGGFMLQANGTAGWRAHCLSGEQLGGSTGTAGQVLTSAGSSAPPTWANTTGVVLALVDTAPSLTASFSNLSCGSYLIPGNTAQLGTTYRLTSIIQFTHTAAATPTITVELVIAGNVMQSVVMVPLSTAGTYDGKIEAVFRFSAVGASASGIATISISNDFGSVLSSWNGGNGSAFIVGLNTTIGVSIELRTRMTTGVASNTLQLLQAYVERLVL